MDVVFAVFPVTTFSFTVLFSETIFTALPQVGKLVVTCRWSAVYSTEP